MDARVRLKKAYKDHAEVIDLGALDPGEVCPYAQKATGPVPFKVRHECSLQKCSGAGLWNVDDFYRACQAKVFTNPEVWRKCPIYNEHQEDQE